MFATAEEARTTSGSTANIMEHVCEVNIIELPCDVRRASADEHVGDEAAPTNWVLRQEAGTNHVLAAENALASDHEALMQRRETDGDRIQLQGNNCKGTSQDLRWGLTSKEAVRTWQRAALWAGGGTTAVR